MTNQNQQIAKILGIQSRFRVAVENYKDCRGMKGRLFITAPNFTSENEANEYIGNIASKYEKASVSEVGVDFKEPSNFLKFLDLIFLTTDGLGHVDYDGRCFVDTIIDDFYSKCLKEVVESAKTNEEWETFKKHAQLIDWNYNDYL